MATAAQLPPAAPLTKTGEFAVLHHRLSELYNDFDRAADLETPGRNEANRDVWFGVRSAACCAMLQPPESVADALIACGLAATWMGTVIDALAEDSFSRPTALAVATVLENTTLLLARKAYLEGLPAEVAVVAKGLINEVVHSGAETAQVAA